MLVDSVVNVVNTHGPHQAVIITSITKDNFLQFADLMLGIICCYLSISFILQTKDDFRFIIPYVEFSKQTKGPADSAGHQRADRWTHHRYRANRHHRKPAHRPAFVIDELQLIADSGDKLKRNRGRRGLDVMQKLRTIPRVEVIHLRFIGPRSQGFRPKSIKSSCTSRRR